MPEAQIKQCPLTPSPTPERVCGGGEEEDGSGQLLEEGRHPLTSQMEMNCVGFQ